MKRLIGIVLVLLLASCQYFNVEKTSTEAILNEELKTFNWNEVDDYPSFKSCNYATTQEDKKQCFEETLSQHILNHLVKQQIVVNQDVNDTILIDFKISELGKLTLINIKTDSLTVSEIPEIKSYITASLDSLPEILPAIKRGQHVKTQFKLPIVVAVN